MVFRDPALAYAMVAVGAVLPDVIDGVLGGVGPGHSVVIGGVLLAGTMLGTRGRRRIRRRLLGIPLGFLLHLVLDGVWLGGPERLWWPLGGAEIVGTLPSFERSWPLLLVLEVAGLVLGWVAWRAIGSTRSLRRDREPPLATGDV